MIRKIMACVLVACATAKADVKMPAIFGDHMVLQQDATLPVWGWARPGEKITVTLGRERAKTKAGADGKWRVSLKRIPKSGKAFEMTVAGKNTLKFTDVLVGDVWLCSGQSNMEFHLPKEEARDATDSQIRFFQVPATASFQPESDVHAKWVVCTPETAGEFSAVAYFFARELRSTFPRPIGLIGSYWVGSAASSWLSISSLRKEPSLKCYVDSYDQRLAEHPKDVARYPELQTAYKAAQEKWDATFGAAYNEAYAKWRVEWTRTQKAGLPGPPEPSMSPAPPAPPLPPDGAGRVPSTIFNGMIAPVIPYAIKGAIWYQGESNVVRGQEYKTLLTRLITDWREQWGEGDFPFLIVQLPNFADNNQDWTFLRESQLKAAQSLPNTGLAVTIDTGEPFNLHPPNKLYVGLRLAQAAKHVAYGRNVIYSGPLFESEQIAGETIRVKFSNIGDGLMIGSAPWLPPGVTPLPTTSLAGFLIAGDDRKWFQADARINGDSVVLSSPQVPRPAAVRYAWENAPRCNLYNAASLPASPFRTDDWPQTTKSENGAPFITVPHVQDHEKGVKN